MKRSNNTVSVLQKSCRSPSPSECHTMAGAWAIPETGASSLERASCSARIASVLRFESSSDHASPPTATVRRSQAAAITNSGTWACKKRSFQKRKT